MAQSPHRLTTVRAFIVANLKRPVSDQELYFESGFVDSLFGLQLIAFLEGQFEIEVADDDLDNENFNSIEHIVMFLDRKLH